MVTIYFDNHQNDSVPNFSNIIIKVFYDTFNGDLKIVSRNKVKLPSALSLNMNL